MAKFKEHEQAVCSVEGCKMDATRWFDTSLMGTRAADTPQTFYLCPEHAEQVSPDDTYAYQLSLHSRMIWKSELAVYSCHDDCPVCNE